MSAPGQDPDRIDVSLNIMSDATLTAVNNLTVQLSTLRGFLAQQAQQTANPAQAQSGGWVAQATGLWTPGQQPIQGISGPVKPVESNNPTDGSQRSRAESAKLRAEYEGYISSLKEGGTPQRPSPEAESMMGHHLSDLQRWKVASMEQGVGTLSPRRAGARMDRFFELYPGAARDPFEDRSYEFEAGRPSGGESAMPEGVPKGMSPYPPQGPTTTARQAQYGDMPGWAQTLQRENITPESRLALTIPRLGEFTIQDKLNMAAQWMGRAAQRRGQYDPDTGETTFSPGATRMGRAAAGAAYLRDQSASIVAVNREFQRLRAFARSEELGGEALGFSRESALGDVEAFGVGARLNLGLTSSAQREAARQEITQRRVQAAPGISGEEAQRIRALTAGMGYSQDLNERLQMDVFRPLQQRGIAPEAVAPLIDQGVRQGNVSLTTLVATMESLAEAAKNANMTLEETTTAALEYAESVQEIGAGYEHALTNAADFTRAGLDPRLAAQIQQNPMTAGILTARTGIAPQLQGALGANAVMGGMRESAQLAMQLGQPYGNQPDVVTRSVTGEVIDRTTGKDVQMAFASNLSGIPVEILKRMERNPDFLETGAAASSMAGRMDTQIAAQKRRTRTTRELGKHEGLVENEIRKTGAGNWLYKNVLDRGSTGDERTEEYSADSLSDEQKRALGGRPRNDGVVQYSELERQMIEMDPTNKDWTKRVRKISKDHGDVEDRLKHAKRIIGEATKAGDEPDTMVGLTPEAAKILKIVKPKDREGALPRANAGGSPANSGFTGPNFPSSTGWMTP
jgi:hypothetical protein